METFPRGVAKRILFLLPHEYTTEGYRCVWVNLGWKGTAACTFHVWLNHEAAGTLTEPSPVDSNRVSRTRPNDSTHVVRQRSVLCWGHYPNLINLIYNSPAEGESSPQWIRLDSTRHTPYKLWQATHEFYAKHMGMHLHMLASPTGFESSRSEYARSSRRKSSTFSTL